MNNNHETEILYCTAGSRIPATGRTESETGASNMQSLGMTAFSGWRLGLFGS